MSNSKSTRPRLQPHQRSGVLTVAQLKRLGVVPPAKRLKQGPCVMVECVENIPCNPCAYACPRKAITIDGELTDTPKVDFSKCNGCTVCIAKCPGLAIFVVNPNYSRDEATVTLPYEMLPKPEPGWKVAGLDRRGKRVCTARIIKVLDTKAQDHCAVVTVAVPRRLWNEVRSIRVAPPAGRKR